MFVKVLGEVDASIIVFAALSHVGLGFALVIWEYLITYLEIGSDPAVAVHESTIDDATNLDGATVNVGADAFTTVASIKAASPKELLSL